jgi:hypothetical protein
LEPEPDGRSSQLEPRLDRVISEHLHRVQRVFVEVLADQGELLEQVVGDGDDVAADLVGMELDKMTQENRSWRLGPRIGARTTGVVGEIDTTACIPPKKKRNERRKKMEESERMARWLTRPGDEALRDWCFHSRWRLGRRDHGGKWTGTDTKW